MNTQHPFKHTIIERSVSLGRQSFRIIFLIGILLFVACLLIQLFTVGMSVFINPSWWRRHTQFAHVIGSLAFILFPVAFLGRFPKIILGLTGLINILLLVQFGTIHLSILPALSLSAAFHPVNAFLLLWTATMTARKTWWIVISSSDAR
jgi:Family of unknown function (DUF6220)